MIGGMLLFILVGIPYAMWRYKKNTRLARELMQQRYDAGLIDPDVLRNLEDQAPEFVEDLRKGVYRL